MAIPSTAIIATATNGGAAAGVAPIEVEAAVVGAAEAHHGMYRRNPGPSLLDGRRMALLFAFLRFCNLIASFHICILSSSSPRLFLREGRVFFSLFVGLYDIRT